MQLDERFERAVEREQSRQEFLDIIVNNSLPRYVAKVVYNSLQLSAGENEILMWTKPNPLVRLGVRGTRSVVEVLPASFALDESHPHKKLDDFRSTLEDHEYFHAREFCYNPRIIAHPVYRKISLVR